MAFHCLLEGTKSIVMFARGLLFNHYGKLKKLDVQLKDYGKWILRKDKSPQAGRNCVSYIIHRKLVAVFYSLPQGSNRFEIVKRDIMKRLFENTEAWML